MIVMFAQLTLNSCLCTLVQFAHFTSIEFLFVFYEYIFFLISLLFVISNFLAFLFGIFKGTQVLSFFQWLSGSSFVFWMAGPAFFHRLSVSAFLAPTPHIYSHTYNFCTAFSFSNGHAFFFFFYFTIYNSLLALLFTSFVSQKLDLLLHKFIIFNQNGGLFLFCKFNQALFVFSWILDWAESFEFLFARILMGMFCC